MKRIYSGTPRQISGTMTEILSIFSIQKAKSHIIRLTAISLVLFLIPLVSAIDFQLASPESFSLNESFDVSISASTSEIYDVKIFVHDESSKTLSEIYNDKWKNPYYYIKESFPSKTTYSIRVIETSNSYEICARLRKTGKSNYDQVCNPISISDDKEIQDDSQENSQNESSDVQIEEPKNTSEESPPEETSSTQDENPLIETENTSSKRIVLNSPKEAKTSENTFVTKQEKLRLYAVYAFTFFCIIIIILLSLRKL